jgi:hypothetical protein
MRSIRGERLNAFRAARASEWRSAMLQVVILPRLPPISRTECRPLIKHNVHLNRRVHLKPARQATVNLRSMARPAVSGGSAARDQLPRKPSHLSRVCEWSNCQRSKRPIRSVQTSARLRLLITRGRRSKPCFDTFRADLQPINTSDSPGGEYTTTSPRCRSHFGHKDSSHNDLYKIGKSQTIFRPREHFPQPLEIKARQQLPSRGEPPQLGPLKVRADAAVASQPP